MVCIPPYFTSALSEIKISVVYDAEDTDISYDHYEALSGVETFVAAGTGINKSDLDNTNFAYSFPLIKF